MKEAITLYPEIHLGQTDRPICFTTQARPLEPGQYQIWEYEFPDHENASGCFFIIPPDARTNVALITDPNTTVQLEITYSFGQCLYTHWHKDVVDAQRQMANSYLIRHGDILKFHKGDVYCLQAGPEGLVVQDITAPPFQPGITEINLEPDDDRLPLQFRKFLDAPTHVAPGIHHHFKYHIEHNKVIPIGN